MTTKRRDESVTEFNIRLICEDAQRTLLTELNTACADLLLPMDAAVADLRAGDPGSWQTMKGEGCVEGVLLVQKEILRRLGGLQGETPDKKGAAS